MIESTRHYTEELQDLLDGRLAAAVRATVERHVSLCEPCREAMTALARGRDAVRGLAPVEPPGDFGARLAHALDEAVAGERRRLRHRRLAVGGGLVAAAAVALLWWSGTAPADPARTAVRDFARYRDGALPLEVLTSEPAAVERYFAERGLDFPARVFDLSMMGYHLVGGRVHRIDGEASALYAYAGHDGVVVCQMFPGTLARIPADAESREHGGITFRIHHIGDTTLVFWQEGTVVCVLVSDGNAEALVQLAYAKAVKVASAPA